MSGQRFRRLEELLGVPVDDQLTEQHFQRLVDAGVMEADDLEFKVTLYDRTDTARAELAKDVSALANHLGGVLIIGMADVMGVASKVRAVPGADDREIRRMRFLIADRVHPLPRFEIIKCVSEVEPSHGFLLVVVPKSSLAPHAVSDPADTALRFWVRYGTQTLPMGETAIADRYRDRFQMATGRAGRIEDVMSQGSARLIRQLPWVAVAVVPESPGVLQLDASGRDRVRD